MTESRRFTIPHLRWYIIFSVFLITAVNYIYRMTLGLSANNIMDEFSLNKEQFGILVAGFMWTYMFSQLFGGIFVDRVGVRLGLGLAVLWWALSSAFAGLAGTIPFVSGLTLLLIHRIFLGAGEGLNWPAGVKVSSEWFPIKERSFATSIFNTGSTVGATIATVLIAWIIQQWGWRWAFGAVGVFGVLFGAYWLIIYRKPSQHPFLSAEELNYINSGESKSKEESVKPFTKKWFAYLANRDILALCLARFLQDPIWWFYTNWIAIFLNEKFEVNILKIGILWMFPMIAADLGNLAGGGISSLLYAKFGKSLNFSRKSVLVFSQWMMVLGIFAALTKSIYVSVFFMSWSCFFYSVYGTTVLTIPADIFDHRYVASISGLTGFFAGLGGALTMWLIGVIWQKYGVVPVFVWAAFTPVLVSMLILFLLRELKERKA